MLKQLGRTSSTLNIHAKTYAQEGLQILAQLVWRLQSRSAIGRDQPQSLEWFFVEVWWFRLDHLNSHDPEGPYVDFTAILFLLYHFRGHPVWCADHCRAL